MKVADLEGVLLDYWVARAQGWRLSRHTTLDCDKWVDAAGRLCGILPAQSYQPSKEWAHGGPIIEREHLVVWPYRLLDQEDRAAGVPQDFAAKRIGMPEAEAVGPSYLVAAMRAYVASRFGAEVPDETPSTA